MARAEELSKKMNGAWQSQKTCQGQSNITGIYLYNDDVYVLFTIIN